MSELVFPRSWDLSPKESDFLSALLRASPKNLSPDALLDALYARNREPDPSIVKVMACKVRIKLAARGLGFVIETAWGRGYSIPAEAKERLLEAAISSDGRATRPPPAHFSEGASA